MRPCRNCWATRCLHREKTEEAGEHYVEAVKVWPDAISLRYDLARAMIRQNRLDEAVDRCQAALNIDPDEFKAHYLLGNIRT